MRTGSEADEQADERLTDTCYEFDTAMEKCVASHPEYEANDGGHGEGGGVVTQPGEVYGDLGAEVLLDGLCNGKEN